MALNDFALAVDGAGQRRVNELADLTTQPHRAAEVRVLVPLFQAAGRVLPLGDQADHRVRRILVELGTVSAAHAGHIARKLDDRKLHAEADAEKGNPVLAGMANRRDLALRATSPETSRNEDRVHALQGGTAVSLDLFGIDVADLDLAARGDAGMDQRLGQRLVGFGQVDILADKGHIEHPFRMFQRVHDRLPNTQISGPGQDPELMADDLVEHLVMQHGRDLVNRIRIACLDHGLTLNVAEEGHLPLVVLGNRSIGAAQKDVGLNADLPQLLDGVLRWFGLQLTRGRNVGNQCQMHVTGVASPFLQTHLADRLQEGKRLDVANRATDLDDRQICPLRSTPDVGLDLVGNVRNHLNCLAEILPAPFLLDHGIVDLAGREVVAPFHARIGKAFVVTEVEIGLGAIFGDKHLTMLERTHRSGIDVDVGIELEMGDFDAARLEDRSQRRGCDSLAKG